jgi:Caspase domain
MLERPLGLFTVLWHGAASAALAEKRVALLLAVEDYDLIHPLANPANDVRALKSVLEGLDFEIFSETDRDLKRTRSALDDFREDAAPGQCDAAVFRRSRHRHRPCELPSADRR